MSYLTSVDCSRRGVLIEAWGGQLRRDLATRDPATVEHQDPVAERC
jgi:hypothetical protein